MVGCRTVLTNKVNADRTLSKRKARIVAKGYSHLPGVDFVETFSPVARLDSTRLLLAVAAEKDMRIGQLDITSACLNGNLNEEVYMEIPNLAHECLKDIAERNKETRKIQETARRKI